jgi:hypothetical protein
LCRCGLRPARRVKRKSSTRAGDAISGLFLQKIVTHRRRDGEVYG